MNTYRIETLDPPPSMNHKVVHFFGTYAQAVAAAHRSWRVTGRSTFVYASRGTTFYHMIAPDGRATDRNTNSEIPPVQQLALLDDDDDDDDEVLRDYEETVRDFLAGTGRV